MKEKTSTSETYEAYANQIIDIFAKEVKKELGFICCGSGGSMPYDVESISISFIAYQRATIEEARVLEVRLIERFLELINSHEKIRPFLREYPFKTPRAEVSIAFNKKDNTRYTDGSVALVFQARSLIFYEKKDEVTGRLSTIKEEPYEEALKIVRESSQVTKQCF